jgi:LruC domain-containing protein
MVQTSCNNKENDDIPDDTKNMNDLVVSSTFNWSTTIESSFNITTLSNIGTPISGVKVGIYTADPLEEGKLIVSGVTDNNGNYSINYEIPAYYDSIFVQTDFVGIVSPGMIELTDGSFDIVLGGIHQPLAFKSTLNVENINTTFTYLGGYNSLGVPDYLEPVNDVITQDLLDDINFTLPSREPLPESHPEYLLPEWDYNLNLIEDCDVWITFVHEGAGYKNALGFYTYETGQTPQTPADIDSITIIFPNVSYLGSGGGLNSGNKVFLGQFTANTTISFALMANGWNNGGVTDGKWIVYSNPDLNPEIDADLKQHTVLLNDNGRDLLLLGIEDIRRDYTSCDQDFNDAVFYVTANPIEAIDQSVFPNIDYIGIDTDGDGIPDNLDDYPDNPDKAFDNFFFNEGNFGTLAYEDMWPFVGDYDFNDAVIDYNFNQVTNADNYLVEIKGIFILRAHGAYYHNGFGFQLPFDKSLVDNVSGDLFVNGGLVSLDNRNLENNQEKPVVIVWEDGYDVLPQMSGGIGVNTTPNIPFVVPDTLNITIALVEPVSLANTGIPPYNPFIFVDGQRDVEVHLVDKAPTDLANTDLFGTGADDSDAAADRYYKTVLNLPWAINIIEHFDYPNEKAEITETYLKFGDWAESNGNLYNNWWKDLSGYRNSDNIYTPLINN